MNNYKLCSFKYSTHTLFSKIIGNKKMVLDVGCNDGYLAKLADKSNIFYGLDNSKPSVGKAKRFFKDVAFYDLNNLQKLPWKLKFDVIVFGDVLEHVYFPQKVLKFFLSNYLKKGGTAVISLPNIANWQMRLSLLVGKFNYSEVGILDKTHLHFYTFKTARELVVSAGLTIKKEYGTALFFGPIIEKAPFLKELLSTSIIIVGVQN